MLDVGCWARPAEAGVTDVGARLSVSLYFAEPVALAPRQTGSPIDEHQPPLRSALVGIAKKQLTSITI